MAVSSLPSNHGVGDFGPTSYEFIDYLEKIGMRVWQILPLNPLGYGNSPYQPYSSYAMDELYISLDILFKEGIIDQVQNYKKDSVRVEYQEVRNYKEKYLKKAFNSFCSSKEYLEFIKFPWVKRYAVFLTFKKENDLKSWHEWPLEQKYWIKNPDALDIKKYQEQINYEMYIQFLLYKQWHDIKNYANKKGIVIVGDIPIYVGIDSEDVWSHQENFLLDETGIPTSIAGVPPDYFSATGQRWGNPLYNWEFMINDHFSFWLERLQYIGTLFDYTRIDHFRAFDTYWKIPSHCSTAIEGQWVEAPGYIFFDTVKQKLPDIKIIAEDLGLLRQEVYDLRDHYHFPGMKIIQFTYNNGHPEDFIDHENMIVYTGTHDNQTIMGWHHEKEQQVQIEIQEHLHSLGYIEESIAIKFIHLAFDNIANMAIIAMQDILQLDDEARMNVPGTIGNPNWQWKIKNFKDLEKQIPILQQLLKQTKRM